MSLTTGSRLNRFALLALCAAFGQVAFADDWKMYRKDAGHTAASTDKIALPLKTAWTWKSQRLGSVGPLSTAVIAGNHVYFVSGPKEGIGKKRILVCADSKTGKAIWASELGATRSNNVLSEDIGPAVSAAGTIYVVDLGIYKAPRSCPKLTIMVKAFDSRGKLIDFLPMPARDGMSRLFLRRGHEEETDFLLTSANKPPT